MADVSECPPDTIPAHLARLDGWREIRRAEKFLRARAEKYGVEYVPGGGAKTLLYKPVGVKGGEA